jgi:hypothetical protein
MKKLFTSMMVCFSFFSFAVDEYYVPLNIEKISNPGTVYLVDDNNSPVTVDAKKTFYVKAVLPTYNADGTYSYVFAFFNTVNVIFSPSNVKTSSSNKNDVYLYVDPLEFLSNTSEITVYTSFTKVNFFSAPTNQKLHISSRQNASSTPPWTGLTNKSFRLVFVTCNKNSDGTISFNFPEISTDATSNSNSYYSIKSTYTSYIINYFDSNIYIY